MEYLKQNKNSMSKSFSLILLLLVFVVFVIFIYYENGYMNKIGLSKGSLSKEETVELFNNAQNFYFRSKTKTLRNRAYISVNKTCYGMIVDNFNIFNSKTYFYVGDKEELFHIGFTHGWKPKNTDKKLITATTYAIYSPNNEIIGHLQETVVEKEGFDRDYFYIYYDQNDNEKEFYIRKGKLYDKKGNVVATTTIHVGGLFKKGIEIFKQEDSVIPYEEILFLYFLRFKDWCFRRYTY